VILQQPPFVAIDVVHQLHEFGMFESVVAEELAHMGPVLLLDVGVVVFAVSATAGKRNAARMEMAVQRPVEELAAVVAVEALHGEGQRLFHVLVLGQNPGRALVSGRTVFRPAAGRIGHRQAVNEVSGGGVTAVGHRVGLQVPRLGGVGRATPQGHLVTQEGTRLGRAQAPAGMTRPQRGQEPVNRRRAEIEQVLAHRGRNPFFKMRQPERDDLLEPFATRLFAREPNRLERPEDLGGVIDRLRPGSTLAAPTLGRLSSRNAALR